MWRSKKQPVVSRSSAEAELRALALAICESIWIRRVMNELDLKCDNSVVLKCDNQATISMAKDSVHHDRTKHVEIYRHFIAEKIRSSEVQLEYTPTREQLADILTKVHGIVDKLGFLCDVVTGSAILDMYAKCKRLDESLQFFYEMPSRNWVSWSAIITGCAQNDELTCGLELFIEMQRNGVGVSQSIYASAFRISAGLSTLPLGCQLHGQALKTDFGDNIVVDTSMLDIYAKCDNLHDARKIFNLLPNRNLQSHNAVRELRISGFSSEEDSERAQNLFARILEMGVKPDNFTYATVLDTCCNVANIGLGNQLHAQIIKKESMSDVYITSTLVDMYSNCGNLQDSVLMFEKSSKRDFVTWNAMVCAYAYHGLAEEALRIFEKMQLEKVTPHHSTFVAVLRACAHIGLVENALRCFNQMQTDYGLEPQLEHFSSMVEILGKSGRLVEALNLIQDMPFEADDVIWRTLLSICKIHGNVEVAEKAASSLLKLDPEDSSAYVLLSNIYADAEMWDEVSKMRKIMRHSRLKKEPGCSWIQVQSELHMFLVGDKSHPRSEEIYENLDVLIDEMKKDGYGTCSLVTASEEWNVDEDKELHAVSCC